MHPSFICSYNTDQNHSKHYQVHYIPLEEEDQPVVRTLFEQQQKPFTDDHNHQPASLIVVPHHENSNLNVQSNMKKSSYNNNNSSHHVVLQDKSVPSKRSSKDRHSKINTARGPRDRRMRLSLDVAKKFFRLQDMLGFDKASNTIEWLIMKSKPAIRDLLSQHSNQSCSSLIGVLNSASSGSECEVLSEIDYQSLDKTGDQDQVSVIDRSTSNKEKKKKKVDRKTVYFDLTLAKETRDKARARARKRTSEKKNIKFGSSDGAGGGCDQYTRLRPSLDKVIDQNTNRLGSWVPFGENQVHTTTTDHQPEYPSSHIQFKQGINAGENSSVMFNNWMPSLFNYHNNPGSSHEHQFSDF